LPQPEPRNKMHSESCTGITTVSLSGFALGPRVAIVEVGDVCVTIRLWSVLSHCSQRVVVVYSTFSRNSSTTG